MRLTGTLRVWHDDRGFGFIAPTRGGRELFVHVSAFPQDGSRPLVGERLDFELGRGKDGKPQAMKVRRLAWAGTAAALPESRLPPRQGRPWLLQGLLAAAIVLGLGAFGYRHARQPNPPAPMAQPESPAATPQAPPADRSGPQPQGGAPQARRLQPPPAPTQRAPAAPEPAWRCDGRTHCSQMTSCAEATFFLRNCPGTQMDGDGDGIPCEDQWCTSWTAR